MEYVIGILLGVITFLFLKVNKKDVILKQSPEEEKLKADIQLNKNKIKKEEELMNATQERKEKTLAELLDYFKHIDK